MIVNIKKLDINPGKGIEKKPTAAERPHVRLVFVKTGTGVPVLPCKREAPLVRSPPKSPSESSTGSKSSKTSESTPSPHSKLPSSTPSSPLSPVLVGPVAMGMVEEIKNALIESNRVAAMPIPQFYRKKGEKPDESRLLSEL